MKFNKRKLTGNLFIILLFTLFFSELSAQKKEDLQVIDSIEIDGQIFSAIVEKGDTMIVAQLEDVYYTSFRTFASREEYLKYMKYKRYAVQMYPYAKDAINILEKLDQRTKEMSWWKRRMYVRQTYQQLEKNFSDQLKNKTRLQGYILTKMIERELDRSLYSIIKEKKNVFSAMYWNQLGKAFDYDIKKGYIKGDDRILDAVLQDFDVSYKEGASPKLNTK
ncbi:MAG TPA: DUF4294 domain-containing protein [Saprospirales bacterium]|nr:DUF4294 domain-containing protein [Saprospirales bacterium]HAY70285.1 DUF4294 domain-containing protein [Saprospirales bacterium]HRQ29474.1 DUF4294 domain-containing protein [Saprospiraceae bacterium]